MNMSKKAGVILVAGFLGMLLAGRIRGRNSASSADPGMAGPASSLPKDIYSDSRNRLPLPKREDMDDYGRRFSTKRHDQSNWLAPRSPPSACSAPN